MRITITRDALRAMLFGILSCHCPVTPETEDALFAAFKAEPGAAPLNLAPYMAAADRNPVRTPLHLFLEFCRYGHDDPARFAIGQEDVIRYFCSRFHYTAALAGLDPVRIPDPASHLAGHLLLVAEPAGDDWTASVGGRTITLRNLFLPRQIEAQEGGLYAVHFGMVLAALTPARAAIARNHLALIPELAILAERIGVIDYADYQRLGDHREEIAARYERHF